MAKTFSGIITSTIQLDAAHSRYNPVTIAGTVVTTTGDGVDGSDLKWTITNTGRVAGNQFGIVLSAGGTITNGSASANGATISSVKNGAVRIGGAAGTVTNFGTVSGAGAAIYLDAGGRVTNGSSSSVAAVISGGTLGGVYVSSKLGTVTNFGTISGFFSGVRLAAGGLLENEATGTLTASNQGIAAYIGAKGTVTNLGTITGSTGADLHAGGQIVNGASGSSSASISSNATAYGPAVRLDGGGTVTNFAHISGHSAVYMLNGGKVVNEAGGVLTGTGQNSLGVFITGGTDIVANYGAITGVSGVFSSGTGSTSVTVINAGTITGTTVAVQFAGGSNMLVIEAGSKIIGQVIAGTGADTLVFGAFGTFSLTGYAGFETIEFASGGAVTLTDSNFNNVTNSAIEVLGGDHGNRVDASALTGANQIIAVGGSGRDVFTGGAGNDVFQFTAVTLNATDVVKGGGGGNLLTITSSGTISASGVSGVATFTLGGSGTNTLMLKTANFTGVTGATITVNGAGGADRLSGAGVAAADLAVFRGGAGNDTLTAGLNTRMTGGTGADQFVLTTPGSGATPATNMITDFAPGIDTIVFHDAGFGLGVDEGKGTSTPQAIDARLFSSHTDGTFATTANRFAYNASTGRLFYDADGSGSTHSGLLVATLNGHPPLTASDLFFVA